jgi:hypothetical protein
MSKPQKPSPKHVADKQSDDSHLIYEVVWSGRAAGARLVATSQSRLPWRSSGKRKRCAGRKRLRLSAARQHGVVREGRRGLWADCLTWNYRGPAIRTRGFHLWLAVSHLRFDRSDPPEFPPGRSYWEALACPPR